jgi:[ribosomal protein S5]-alanine N-acetyltransferase
VRIVTPRLALRPLVVEDLAWLTELDALPEVRRFLFDDRALTSGETAELLIGPNARLWEEEGLGLFVVEHQAVAIGWAGFWYFHEPPVREVGYAMHPLMWGRGFAGESARGVMAFGMARLGDQEFRASTDAPNVASIRVLERLGFTETRRSPGISHETVHFSRPADLALADGIRIED